jgi:Diguanylate cyclase, GGDEF domain
MIQILANLRGSFLRADANLWNGVGERGTFERGMSDSHVNSSKPARRNGSFLSIRARLIVLTLVAIAPLTLACVHELESARQARTEAVHTEVIDLARRGVEAQREIIYSVRAFLQIVSRVYARIPLDTSSCNQYIADLTANIPWIRDLPIATTDGRITCGHVTVSIGVESMVPEKFQSAADLVEAADNALYAAKRRGRNTVVARMPALLRAVS